MTPEEKLSKIKEQNKKRQAKYLEDPEKAAKHAAANKASYEKRKQAKAAAAAPPDPKKEEPKKEIKPKKKVKLIIRKKKDPFANPYASDAKPDPEMVKELQKFITEIKEQKDKPKPKKKFIILRDNYDYLEKIINEKIESQASKNAYLNSLKRLFNLFDEKFLTKIYRRKDLLETIKTQFKGRGVSAVAADIQTLLKMNTIAELGISDALIKKIKLAHDASKIETLDKAADKSYPPLDEYFKKLEDTFSKDSKQRALAELMSEVPSRDDFVLKVVDSVKDASDLKTNYIVLNKSPTGRIILHRFKTDKGFSKLDKSLTTRLTNILKRYMMTKKEDDRDYLFGDKKLSKFVGDMNKKMGYPKGGVGLLRHMAVQKFLSVPRTADEKAIYADMMKHSPATQTKYNMNKKDAEK